MKKHSEGLPLATTATTATTLADLVHFSRVATPPANDPTDRAVADDAPLAEVAALMGLKVADLYIVGLAADRLNISPATLAKRLPAGATPDDLKEIAP